MSIKKFFTIIFLVILFSGVLLYTLGFLVNSTSNNENKSAQNFEEQKQDEDSIIPEQESVPVGSVGEIPGKSKQEDSLAPLPNFPVNIFSTSGIIKEITDKYLIIEGDGSNFADQQSRELKAFIPSNILIFTKNKTRHKGIEAIKFLQTGDNVLITSKENIRGKTSFIIKTISILK